MSNVRTNLTAMLEFIHNHITNRGFSPSVREIRDGLRLSSTSVVLYALRGLREKGLIDYQDGLNRTISITAEGREKLNA